jgi:hypothetical protein
MPRWRAITRPGQPSMQRPDLPVPGQAPLPALRGQHPRLGLGLGRCDRNAPLRSSVGLAPGLLKGTQIARVGGERHLQRLGQVLHQVEAVRDLHSSGRAVVGALGIGTSAVARDHRHTGVLAQPPRQGVRLAVGQQRHRPVPIEIDQHGARLRSPSAAIPTAAPLEPWAAPPSRPHPVRQVSQRRAAVSGGSGAAACRGLPSARACDRDVRQPHRRGRGSWP